MFYLEFNYINFVLNKMFEYMVLVFLIICLNFESWKLIVLSNLIGFFCDLIFFEDIVV